MEASSLLSKILGSTVLLQQIHGSGYFSLPDFLLFIQAEVSVSKPVLKINHSVHYENKTKPRMIKHQLIREQVDRRANSVIFSLNQMLNHF